jgi:CheY-like chemotaxis protein
MRETETTSWRRLSDQVQKPADARRARGAESPQLETWENEGGQSALSTVAPMRILIVDSDIKSADSLELMLHALCYSETRVAYSGHAALAVASEFRPSLVLLELRLLDMSGYEAARLLRERAQTNDLRLLALTSSREHAGREHARLAGFERYLLKPIAALNLSALLQMDS